MKKISICNDLSDICKDIKLGCIQYKATVEKRNDALIAKINEVCSNIESSFSIDEVGNEPSIKAARNVYRSIGKDPHRYRISSEALMRRILQGKGIYYINNVVDCNNLISLKTGLSVGSYDINNLGEKLLFRVGTKEESYKGIGKETINVENLPVFADENGAYGSPTSDSEKAMITNKSTNIMTVLISFDEKYDMDKALEEAVEILKEYVNAHEVETCVSQCI